MAKVTIRSDWVPKLHVSDVGELMTVLNFYICSRQTKSVKILVNKIVPNNNIEKWRQKEIIFSDLSDKKSSDEDERHGVCISSNMI